MGRGAELARLRAAWAGARAGRRRLLLVTGEAGIGRSRLAAELAALAERDGATVLFGSCDKRLGVSFLPFRAALRPYLAARPTEQLRALVGPDGGELVRLWPDLARRLPDLPSPTHRGHEAERYLLFEAVADLLDAIAATGPVLLVVDDLHEADEQSLALLRSLAHVPRPAAVLVLLAAGDDAAGGVLPGALADLLRAPAPSAWRSAASARTTSRPWPRRSWAGRSVPGRRRWPACSKCAPGATRSSSANWCGIWRRPARSPAARSPGRPPARPWRTSRTASAWWSVSAWPGSAARSSTSWRSSR